MNHRQWVRRHNPVLTGISPETPLTVGNGSFAFTADISGFQTLYRDYLSETPLCTMADWGWHSIPASAPGGRYTLSDVRMERFSFCGREVTYASAKYPGNEQVYDWLRENPHKADLARVGLRLNGKELVPSDFSTICQTLDLYSGVLKSRYLLQGVPCEAITACDPEQDILAFRVTSDLLASGLSVEIAFPYGSPDITGADWNAERQHRTQLEGNLIRREMNDLRYTVRVDAPQAVIERTGAHTVRVTASGSTLSLALSFAKDETPAQADADAVIARSAAWWGKYWEKGGMLDLSASAASRAMELERRVVLSLYLLAVNSAGRMLPAETGLTCNSWYGKAHLEMHFWHMAWAPLWGHGDLLERSLPWYHAHLPEARANATRNGYLGARWPKMVADDALDSPSPIAVLLVWQQPHILTMLDLIRRAKPREEEAPFLKEHWLLVKETADFMADYAVKDARGTFHIEPPVIPVQERYDPRMTRDPAFEVAYWKFGLGIAIRWAERMGKSPPDAWRTVYRSMAQPPLHNGLYTAHADAPDTFTDKLNDHPSMLQCFGLLPGEEISPAAMARTLKTVIEKWDYGSLWGWDFAVLCMTALRLGDTETALNQLLCDTVKNTYVASGNNRQESRNDLPLYLPGNGSLLLACAMLAAGWDGCDKKTPGFSPASGWQAAWEGILPWY